MFISRHWLEPLSRLPKTLSPQPKSFLMSFPGKVEDWYVTYLYKFVPSQTISLGLCIARSSRYRKDPYRRSSRGKSSPSSVYGWLLRVTHQPIGVGSKTERHTTSKITIFMRTGTIFIVFPPTKACYGVGCCSSHWWSRCMIILTDRLKVNINLIRYLGLYGEEKSTRSTSLVFYYLIIS